MVWLGLVGKKRRRRRGLVCVCVCVCILPLHLLRNDAMLMLTGVSGVVSQRE